MVGDGLLDLQVNAVALDAQGRTTITGSLQGTVDFDPTAGVRNVASAGNRDLFVALDINADGGDGTLVRFDLATGAQLGLVPLPPDFSFGYFHPFGFDAAPDGTFWVTQPNSGQVAHVAASGALLAANITPGVTSINGVTGAVSLEAGENRMHLMVRIG